MLRAAFPCLICLVSGLAACAPFPDLASRESPGVATAAYPTLLPLDTLVQGPPVTATPAVIAGVDARVAALRAQAARLSGSVVDAGTRARMRRGVSAPF